MASKPVSGNAGELHMRIVLCLEEFQIDSVLHRPEMKVGCRRPKKLMAQWKVYISQPPGLVQFGFRFALCRDSISRRLTILSGCSSIGRVPALQAGCCGFETHYPLEFEFVAQMVEQQTFNLWVASSTLAELTKVSPHQLRWESS